MPTIALLGASGQVGRLIATELGARGHRFLAAGRAPERVRAATAGVEEHVTSIRTVDVTDARSLEAALVGVDLVINAVGPFGHLGRPVVSASSAAGAHLVDLSFEPDHARWLLEHADGAARAVGTTIVSGAGCYGFVGDVLASVAAGAVEEPTEVHVAYEFRGGVLGGTTAGTLRTIAAMLGEPGAGLEHGETVAELPGEIRRLAWFPRPVGPSHAAGVPGVEPQTVPGHVPGVRTVRTYLAMSSLRAELLQLTANAARWAPARRRLERRLLARAAAAPDGTPGARWACVVEAAGSGVAKGVARAWAYGHDPGRTSAAIAVLVAEAVLDGHVPTGLVPPALVGVPSELLDELSARTGARWSVSRPGSS